MSQENKTCAREIVAKNIAKLRKEKKLKREELSLILGFDNSYISKLEKGNINITIDKLEMLADLFKVDIYKLLK